MATESDIPPNPLLIKVSRLGECEVCGVESAKYKCPACQIKTCSLPCVDIHKKELECSGIRNKVQFKHIKDFTDIDLHSDYSLLEEMGRSVERVSRGRRNLQKNLAFKWQKLKNHLYNNGTYLYLLPPKFSKHVNNTSYLDWSTGIVYWKLEWVFPQAEKTSSPFIDSRADETTTLEELVRKHLQEKDACERLKPYFEEDGSVKPFKVLLKGERTPGPPKYLLMNLALSLGENLQGKVILEHPTFHVVLTSHLNLYEIVAPENLIVSKDTIRKRGDNRRFRGRKRPRGQGRNSLASGSINFFSDQLSDSDSD